MFGTICASLVLIGSIGAIAYGHRLQRRELHIEVFFTGKSWAYHVFDGRGKTVAEEEGFDEESEARSVAHKRLS